MWIGRDLGRPRGLVPVIAVLFGLCGWPATAAVIDGKIELAAGAAISADDLAQGTVVYYRPGAAPGSAGAPEKVEIDMRRKEFVPRVVAVPVGSTVRFPNLDPILHNVFSISPGNGFDLGLYRQGEGKEAVFQEAGVVRVFCNVHHSMVAYVVVLDTPFHGRVAADGSFELTGVPEGRGELTVWNERSAVRTITVDTGDAAGLRIELEADRAAVPKHANKLGKPYPRSRRDRVY